MVTRRPVGAIGGRATIFATALGVGLVSAALTIAPEPGEHVVARTTAPGMSTTPTTQSETTRLAGFDIARLEERIQRRLDRVNPRNAAAASFTLDGGSLTVEWTLAEPRGSAGASKARDSVETRGDQLRRELRRILRSLATAALPDEVTTVRLVGIAPVENEADPRESLALDAVFDPSILTALDADDVRLADATLEELLGLAEEATGDAGWGVPRGS